MNNKEKVIPFKYYGKFIAISILFIVAISGVVYTNFINDHKYDFPFIEIMKDNQKVVRIYPAASFKAIVVDNNPLTFNKTKTLVNKSISYEDLSDFTFGRVDHYIDLNLYKIYNKFDLHYLTLYEKNKKIIGFTYKYLFNKSGTFEFPEREYIYQDVLRLERIIGNNYTIESGKNSKSFIATRFNRIYVFTIIGVDISGNTLSEIVSQNKHFSLNISVFHNMDSYNDTRLHIEN